jgi:hypothetical protein
MIIILLILFAKVLKIQDDLKIKFIILILFYHILHYEMTLKINIYYFYFPKCQEIFSNLNFDKIEI